MCATGEDPCGHGSSFSIAFSLSSDDKMIDKSITLSSHDVCVCVSVFQLTLEISFPSFIPLSQIFDIFN
jgi:hypothetical protein